MSKEVLIILHDDLDGSGGDDVTTYYFTDHRGDKHEIELSDAGAAVFDAAMAPFIKAGRPVKKPVKRRKKQTKAAPASSNGDSSAESRRIRDWANANGFNVGDRGVIASEVIEAYEQADPPECQHLRTYGSGPRKGKCTKCLEQIEVEA